MDSLQRAIESFRRDIATAPARLLALTGARVNAPLRAGGWTCKLVLGHLLDSATNNHHRFIRAQFEPHFAMPAYAQESWVEAARYEQRSWPDLVEFWTVYNRHLLHLIETMPREFLARECRIGIGDPVTLEFLMVDYVDHMEHHLNQILNPAA